MDAPAPVEAPGLCRTSYVPPVAELRTGTYRLFGPAGRCWVDTTHPNQEPTMRTHPNRPRRPGPLSRSALLALLAWLAACSSGEGVTDPDDSPQDPCLATPSITMGQSLGGTLATNDCRRNGFVSDRWELELSSAMNVQVDLTSQSFDPYLEIRTPGGALVAENDDWGSYNSRILRELPAGRYLLVVRGFDPSATGPYTLSVQEGPDCGSLADLAPGSVVDGALASGDCMLPFAGLVDWYALSLSQARKLRIEAVASFDEIVLLADRDGNIFDGADWNHPSGHARLESRVPAGDWLVGVASPTEAQRGAYTLSVQDPPACTPGGALTLGETLEGTLTGEDCVFDGWTPADSVGLELSRPTDLAILAKSTDMDPLVVVRDTAGMDVAVAYVQVTQGVAEARVSLPAGSYAVFVASTSWPGTGTYSLTVDEIVCTDTGTLALGATVQGSLDSSDCVDGQGRYREAWSLGLDTAASVQLDLSSASFDAFLILQDADGNEIARDDDGGGGTNSRLTASLDAGSYRVVASSFSPGATGDYTLSAGAPSAASTAAPATGSGMGRLKSGESAGPTPEEVLRGLMRSSVTGAGPATLIPVKRKD